MRIPLDHASVESTIASECVALHEIHMRDAQHAAQLIRGHFHGAGRRRSAGRRLRERGGQRRVKSDVAFHFLHDLVNMAVQDGDRAEALQVSEGLLAVVGAPAPVGIDGPERDVRKDDDRRAAFQIPHVIFEPLELLGAERTEAACFEIHHIDQADEVRALVVKAVLALSFGIFAEAVQVLFAVVGEHVVLAGNVENPSRFGALEDLLGRVKFRRLGELRNIAGMQQEIRGRRRAVDAIDGDLECRGDVGIGFLAESDVGVADLDEAEIRALHLRHVHAARRPASRQRFQNAAVNE